jgi:EpsD family peptidyl-prolyl cis-trans isomerase
MNTIRVLAAARFALCAAALSAVAAAPVAAGEKPAAASGKTQVVARAAGKEITLSELRLEMARLGLPAVDPDAERAALQSLVNRTVMARAARAASLHKRPEGVARMYAAQDQALADYYLAIASQPTEPADHEIEAFIAANPTLFARRRAYDFLVMSIETKNFDEKTLTPLFDEEKTFDRLAGVLQKAGARYSIATASETGAAFPEPIREQLARYTVSDNIVIKGDATTQILKIAAIRQDPMPAREQGALARRMLLEERAGARMQETLSRLTKSADIAYFRPSAAPKAAPKTAEKQ